ncbi:hypothetical protein BLA15945_02587 [Burkholderia lata]|uniref:Uncharacterized protein n=1 Tax=Burkholderia lata (strain ATCC 17760 / DSM 23089 / LMG 22485 / NCIMB 9086 / R18194 / 383) TaxID=482957 RepID=A0A6P2KIJ2_BURL3|nr:hypothetical protein BLA15945_02587 [Burkholderia lata]
MRCRCRLAECGRHRHGVPVLVRIATPGFDTSLVVAHVTHAQIRRRKSVCFSPALNFLKTRRAARVAPVAGIVDAGVFRGDVKARKACTSRQDEADGSRTGSTRDCRSRRCRTTLDWHRLETRLTGDRRLARGPGHASRSNTQSRHNWENRFHANATASRRNAAFVSARSRPIAGMTRHRHYPAGDRHHRVASGRYRPATSSGTGRAFSIPARSVRRSHRACLG